MNIQVRKNKFPALVCRLVLAAVLFAALALPLFFNREVNAAGPSVKILTPANGSVLTLDYNEFNLSVHYYVDVEKNAGSIFLTFYNDHYQKVKLGDNAIGAYSPGHAYPLDWTSNVRAWVPSPPAGTYKIRAELWRWELQSGIYRHIEIVATDEISVTIPVSGSNTVAPAAPASTPKPGTSTATAPLPAKTTAAPASTTTAPSAIYVYSTPGDAEIWMNGKYRVNTNFSPTGVGFTDLQPGSYNVTLRKEGYKDYTETVNLKSNEIRDIKAVLQQGLTPTGWIVVNSDPAGASVIINNKQIATSQATITEVQPVSYNLTLKKDG